jgi:hypothetical protein
MMKKPSITNLSLYLLHCLPIFIAFLVCAAAEEARNPWQGARVDLHSRLLLMGFQQAAVSPTVRQQKRSLLRRVLAAAATER